jgi:hypothetical protein
VLKFFVPSAGISPASAGKLANAKPAATSAFVNLICMISPPTGLFNGVRHKKGVSIFRQFAGTGA